MEENRYAITIGVAISMMVLASLAFGLRLEARRMRRSGFKEDDWLILVALLLLYGMAICNLIGTIDGYSGTHYSIDSTDPPSVQRDKAELRGEVIWALNLFCSLAPGFCRISILCFYKRIFVGKVFSVTCWTMIGLNACWCTGYFFSNIFDCYPIQGNWAPGVPPQTCVNLIALYQSMPVSGVLLDSLTLTIPWYPTWKLQMPVRQKLVVSGIFLLGGAAVIASVFRTIAMFEALQPTEDGSWAHAPAFYWATIESGIGITAACLPIMRPLLDKPGPETLIRGVRRMASIPFSRSKMSFGSTDDYSHRPSKDSGFGHSFSAPARNEMTRNDAGTNIYTGDLRQHVQHNTTAENDSSTDLPLPLHGIAVQSSISHSRGDQMV